MENKTARLTILIDPGKKKAFEALCASQDITPSQVVRQMVREYLERYDSEKPYPLAGRSMQIEKIDSK